MTQTVIENGTIISMDPEIGDRSQADILIDDGEIAAIDDDFSDISAERIDAADAIVTPGIVDPHLHAYQSLIRGIVGGWSMAEYVANVHGPIDAAYRPRDSYLGTLFSAYEQLNAGVTTVFDFSHNTRSSDHADRSIDALEESGIRAIFAHGPPNGSDVREEWHGGNSTKRHSDYIRDLRENRLQDDDARVTLGMAPRGPDFTTLEVAREELQLAKELDVPVSIHAGVKNYADFGGDDLVALKDDGLLDESTSITHGNGLDRETLAELADGDVPFIVTPEAEMQVGHGLPGTDDFLDLGIEMSVGVDVISIFSGEMFTQMRMALQTQRAFKNQEQIDRGEDVVELPLTTRDALAWATIDAASCIGLEDKVGSLTPGKRADISIISTRDINTIPSHNPVDTVVLQANPSNVKTVLVDGDVVKRDGELVEARAAQLKDELVEASQDLLSRAGVK